MTTVYLTFIARMGTVMVHKISFIQSLSDIFVERYLDQLFLLLTKKISRFKENKTRNHNFPLSTYESKYLSDFFSDCLTMVFLHHLDTIIWLWRWDNWPVRGSNKTETWSSKTSAGGLTFFLVWLSANNQTKKYVLDQNITKQGDIAAADVYRVH